MSSRIAAFGSLAAWIRGDWLDMKPCSTQLRHLRSVVPVSWSRVEELERGIGAVLPADLRSNPSPFENLEAFLRDAGKFLGPGTDVRPGRGDTIQGHDGHGGW